MNKTQLKRWRLVSIGLAKNSYPNMTEERRKKLIDEVERFIDGLAYIYPLQKISDWDGNGGSVYVCDELTEHLDRHIHCHYLTREDKGNKFANQVSCCVRAGFDIAVNPSGGVLGYTAGDLRACFKRELPKWAANFFDPPLSPEIPDNAELWL